jgi:hypothetical protein
MVRRSVVPLVLALALTSACKNPFKEGCKQTHAMDSDCGILDGSDWYEPPAGFGPEELDLGDPKQKGAAETIASVAASTVTSTGARDLDGLETFVLNSYLLHYVRTGVGRNDCRKSSKLSSVRDLLLSRDASGGYRYLVLGARWNLASTTFSETLVSADLRSKIETDFSKLMGDAAKSKVAASAVLKAMSENVRQGFVAGTYRYVGLKNDEELWQELRAQDAVVTACNDGDLSVGHGIVVVALNKSESLVEKTVGTNFEAALQGAVTDLPAELVGKLKASVELAVTAEIKTAVKKHLKLELERPAIVPLRWKPARPPPANAREGSGIQETKGPTLIPASTKQPRVVECAYHCEGGGLRIETPGTHTIQVHRVDVGDADSFTLHQQPPPEGPEVLNLKKGETTATTRLTESTRFYICSKEPHSGPGCDASCLDMGDSGVRLSTSRYSVNLLVKCGD